MGFLDLFRGQRKNPQKPPDIPIAHDDTGETIYSDDIILQLSNIKINTLTKSFFCDIILIIICAGVAEWQTRQT